MDSKPKTPKTVCYDENIVSEDILYLTLYMYASERTVYSSLISHIKSEIVRATEALNYLFF